jgi:metallo-beta-lactamase family protein
MKITIHRVNNIFWGYITIIEHDGCKIIIDLGSNFPGSHQEELSREDIDSLTAGANALFYTRYHGGHTGLYHLVRPEVSQYIGEGVKDVMTCKYEVLSKHDNHLQTCRLLQSR